MDPNKTSLSAGRTPVNPALGWVVGARGEAPLLDRREADNPPINEEGIDFASGIDAEAYEPTGRVGHERPRPGNGRRARRGPEALDPAPAVVAIDVMAVK